MGLLIGSVNNVNDSGLLAGLDDDVDVESDEEVTGSLFGSEDDEEDNLGGVDLLAGSEGNDKVDDDGADFVAGSEGNDKVDDEGSDFVAGSENDGDDDEEELEVGSGE